MMTPLLDCAAIKDQISLSALLAGLGFQPARRSGKELFYLSMLRDSDTAPSFTVDDDLGVWYDHGLGKGGNVIDFGLAYWKNLSFKEVLAKLRAFLGQESEYAVQVIPSGNSRKKKPVRIPHYEIEDILELGTNPAITDYLQRRGVWDEAQGKLKEIYYYVEDQKKQRKHFFAAGLQNELGGWEVRNKYFKGCIGHKALTLIPGDERKLAAFEGTYDYLSWRHEHPGAPHSILVLNSVSLIEAAIRHAIQFPHIEICFDHNKAGRQATAQFLKALPYAADCSHHYTGYEDYNDKRKAEVRQTLQAQCPPKDFFSGIRIPFGR